MRLNWTKAKSNFATLPAYLSQSVEHMYTSEGPIIPGSLYTAVKIMILLLVVHWLIQSLHLPVREVIKKLKTQLF